MSICKEKRKEKIGIENWNAKKVERKYIILVEIQKKK